MSNLSLWKLLRNGVRGLGLQQTKRSSLEGEENSPLKTIYKKPEKKALCSQSYLQEFIFQEQVQKSLEKWSKTRSQTLFHTNPLRIYEEIYDLLGDGTLTPEMVEKVMVRLISDRDFHPVALFQLLENFYLHWCQGEFIDAPPDSNLPMKKMLHMLAQNRAIALRQVDINTGLNVLILLLELHRFAQQREDLQQKIIFYPSGQQDTNNFFTSQLLRIINYSDAIELGNFSNVVGEFLRSGNFSGAYLGDANLTNVNFSRANLRGAYLGDANLTGANLTGANLSTANLGDANLNGTNLSGANLRGADLSGAHLTGANLSSANLSHTDLSSTHLSSANLSNANLKGANLTDANLKDADLSSANLNDATFFGANISDAKLNSVDLSHADLCRADLSGADLSQATLIGANLSDSILFSTNLSLAVLVAADLSYAKLNGANLKGANLKGAILLGADLNGVDLSGVILNEADLSGVILNEADLAGADLSDAVLFGTDLSYANLSSANLSGSNLSGAILSGADLSHTNLSYAILGGADLSDANLEEMTWNENLEWDGVRGLESAVNVPVPLKQQLGLR